MFRERLSVCQGPARDALWTGVMPPAARGRKLKCGQCEAGYRSTFRGRHPLCFSCQERAKEQNSLQTLSCLSTSCQKTCSVVSCHT
eukprot:5508467-Prymnesium_polylepis.1